MPKVQANARYHTSMIFGDFTANKGKQYWVDPDGRKCPYCNHRLYRYHFSDRKDGLKCRHLGCPLENSHQGYARTKW
jgi:hypothetical protein